MTSGRQVMPLPYINANPARVPEDSMVRGQHHPCYFSAGTHRALRCKTQVSCRPYFIPACVTVGPQRLKGWGSCGLWLPPRGCWDTSRHVSLFPGSVQKDHPGMEVTGHRPVTPVSEQAMNALRIAPPPVCCDWVGPNIDILIGAGGTLVMSSSPTLIA